MHALRRSLDSADRWHNHRRLHSVCCDLTPRKTNRAITVNIQHSLSLKFQQPRYPESSGRFVGHPRRAWRFSTKEHNNDTHRSTAVRSPSDHRSPGCRTNLAEMGIESDFITQAQQPVVGK